MKIVHLQITSDNNITLLKIIKRVGMMLLILFLIPRLSDFLYVSGNSNYFVTYFFIISKAFYFLVILIYFIYIFITKDRLFYEKYSDTYITSTLKK